MRKIRSEEELVGLRFVYHTWTDMKQRCLNNKNRRYKDYGGRGIKVCNRWLGKDGFVNFLADMGERPVGKSLDRIDNDGNYEPSNCRWATVSEQNLNQRKRESLKKAEGKCTEEIKQTDALKQSRQ